MTQSLRFGLVGTGHWARITHAPALASTDGIEFAAVWGRDPGAASDLAASYRASEAPALSVSRKLCANMGSSQFPLSPPTIRNWLRPAFSSQPRHPTGRCNLAGGICRSGDHSTGAPAADEPAATAPAAPIPHQSGHDAQAGHHP
jgi:hypothetical protein